jgi:hypothetical protein
VALGYDPVSHDGHAAREAAELLPRGRGPGARGRRRRRPRFGGAGETARAPDREHRDIAHITAAQFLVSYVVGAIGGVIVFLHADRNGSRHPTAWAIAVFFIPLVLAIYFIRVYRIRKQRR